MLLFAVVFVAGWLFSTLGQMRDAMDARRPLLQAFLFVVFGVYFAWFWARGQTLAMKTWDIRVVDRNGRPLTPAARIAALLLELAVVPAAAGGPGALQASTVAEIAVLWLGWVAVWALLSRFHPQRQFWHDALAGTRLVSAPSRSR